MRGILGKVHNSSPVLFRIEQSESYLFSIVYSAVLFGTKSSVYETPPPLLLHLTFVGFAVCYLQYICHPDISLVFLNKVSTLY